MSTRQAFKSGIIWGLITGVIHTLFMALVIQVEYSIGLLLVTILIWLLGGLVFGFTMKWLVNRRNK